ncbi:MAG TPA: molybdopterin-dependent oxidoreductase [Bacteroidales bacterium]|nr:molybdopterin-dependent oxidoreductase [Bacteroidales bacterium]
MSKSKLSRRSFLLMTGTGGAALMLEPGHQFINKLIPYVNPPVYPKPGEWAYYSTTCRECPAGCGLLMWHRDGRVTKADGNPLHTINKGKICTRGQASVQGEYNADRFSKVLQGNRKNSFKESNWDEAFQVIRNEFATGRKALLISDLQTGSLAEAMTDFTHQMGNSEPLFYEPLNYEALRLANKEMYGSHLIPRYSIDDSDLIVSFGADFLSTWLSPVEYARDFGNIHSFKDGNIAKLIYVGPAETITATNADEFFISQPGTEAGIIYQVIHLLAAQKKVNPDVYASLSLPAPQLTEAGNTMADKLAGLIASAKSPVALAGNPADASREGINLVKASNLLNELLNNQSKVDFSQFHAISKTALSNDVSDFFSTVGENHILFIHNCNPVYSIPGIERLIERAATVVFIGHQPNETAVLADWILPSHYPLEDWGDYEPWQGTISLIQPTMQPIYDTKSAGDILLQLSGNTSGRSFKEIVRSRWLAWNSEQSGDILRQPNEVDDYATLLRNGTIQRKNKLLPVGLQQRQFVEPEQYVPEENRFFLYTFPSLFFYDGRLSNRPWLQEIPDPVSNIVWQSWLDMHPEMANKMDIMEGDLVKVTSGSNQLVVAVRLTQNVDMHTVALEIGQGHQAFGATANKVGVNAFQLANIDNKDTTPVVSIEKTGKSEVLLYLNATEDQHDRELLKEISLTDMLKGSVQQEEVTWPTPEGYHKDKDLYPPHEHKAHRWGMVIDLQSCIGCKACETACYAENNIPVVGKKNCSEGKEMSWLKVPPYQLKSKKTAFLPTPCQHCDAAPCEPVCPVFASVHTQEGLNAQIYNRCVGTRYCSNNCPYKVRRFNWSNITHEYPATLQLNPEVTVRERGVMEKCTFCIQRIRNVEEKAKVENRKVGDGEIVTACQQTCPTSAIVFGDINDPNSAVSKLMSSERRYQLLKELNTKPSVIYLKKLT